MSIRATLFLKTVGENPSASSRFRCFRAVVFIGVGRYDPVSVPIFPPVHPCPPSSVESPSTSPSEGPVTRLRAHLGNLGWSHLEIHKLITSAKIHFPNKGTVTGLGANFTLCTFFTTVNNFLIKKKIERQSVPWGRASSPEKSVYSWECSHLLALPLWDSGSRETDTDILISCFLPCLETKSFVSELGSSCLPVAIKH